MTLFELRRLCKLWQGRLRITDWTVAIAFGSTEGTVGTSEWNPREMVASVIIDPTIDDERYLDGGYEQTIIHELLHIVLGGATDYEHEDVLQERAINQIADALYWAYRRKRKA